MINKLVLEKEMSNTSPETVACGQDRSLLVDGAGRVWTWGSGALGHVAGGNRGEGEPVDQSRPVVVEALAQSSDCSSGEVPFRAVRVAAGESFSVAVSDKGETRAWGIFQSFSGPFGFDSNTDAAVPQLLPSRLPNLSKSPVSQVVCGQFHALALTTEGRVYSWGSGEIGQLGRRFIERRKRSSLTPCCLLLKKIVLIGSGACHSFAVNQDGHVYGWGYNNQGQLGIGRDASTHLFLGSGTVHFPTRIDSLSPENHNGARVVAISGGSNHSVFLFNNGEVWVVGSYENSELGLSKNHEKIKKRAAERDIGRQRLAAYKSEGYKRMEKEFEEKFRRDHPDTEPPEWDSELHTKKFDAAAERMNFVPREFIDEPVKLDFKTRIIDIDCGPNHSLAVDEHGKAYVWGLFPKPGEDNVGGGSDASEDHSELIDTPCCLPLKNRVFKCEAGDMDSIFIGIEGISPPSPGSSEAELDENEGSDRDLDDDQDLDDDPEELKSSSEEVKSVRSGSADSSDDDSFRFRP